MTKLPNETFRDFITRMSRRRDGMHPQDDVFIKAGFTDDQVRREANKMAHMGRLHKAKIGLKNVRYYVSPKAAHDAVEAAHGKRLQQAAAAVYIQPPVVATLRADAQVVYPENYKFTRCPSWPGHRNTALDEISPLLKSRTRA